MSTTDLAPSPWWASVPTITLADVIEAERNDLDALIASYDGCITDSLADFNVIAGWPQRWVAHHIVSLAGERLTVGQVRFALRQEVQA